MPWVILSRQGNQGVEDIGGPGMAEELARASGEGAVSRNQLRAREHPGQSGLACASSPSLGNHRGRNHGLLPRPVDLGEQRPGVSISPIECDECSCIKDAHAAGG